MTKVLVSYQFDASKELQEDLWVMRTFGSHVWNGRTTANRTMIFTLALEPEDALFVGLNRNLCPTPGIWQNALTTGGVS